MDKSRRKFISYISILGIVGMSGLSLQAMEFNADEGVYVDHSHLDDDAFDPDGWL